MPVQELRMYPCSQRKQPRTNPDSTPNTLDLSEGQHNTNKPGHWVRACPCVCVCVCVCAGLVKLLRKAVRELGTRACVYVEQCAKIEKDSTKQVHTQHVALHTTLHGHSICFASVQPSNPRPPIHISHRQSTRMF